MKDQILENLNKVGICVIEDYFPKEFCNQAVNDIEEALNKYPSKIQSESKENTSGDYRLFKMENHYETAQKFSTESLFLDVGSSYLNYPTKSHFVLGGKVSYQNHQTTNSGGGWHRDNRSKQIKTIVYLTDVDEQNGPFLFMPLSNQFDLTTRDGIGKVTRYKNEVIEQYCKNNNYEYFTVTGKKGTVIFADTSFIHRGADIKRENRYTYTNYYFEDHPQRLQLTEEKWGKMFI